MTMLDAVTPILRIFDETKAREFYIGFLGFKIDFEHRFAENTPLYLGISHGNCVLHLSEHHGDSTPGLRVRVPARNLNDYMSALRAKKYAYANPGNGEQTPWGTIEVTITDPFGNRLTFVEDVTS